MGAISERKYHHRAEVIVGAPLDQLQFIRLQFAA